MLPVSTGITLRSRSLRVIRGDAFAPDPTIQTTAA